MTCSLGKLGKFSNGNNIQGAPASNTDGFLLRDVFLQLSWIGQFGTKYDSRHLAISD
jgi:hypothetical protein